MTTHWLFEKEKQLKNVTKVLPTHNNQFFRLSFILTSNMWLFKALVNLNVTENN